MGRESCVAAAPTAGRPFLLAAAGSALALAVSALLFGTDLASIPVKRASAQTGHLLANGFVVAACIAAGWRDRAARLAWGLLAGAAALWLAGDAALALDAPVWLWAAAWTVSVPVSLAAMLAFPTAVRRSLDRVRTLLDALIAAVAAFFFGWTLVLDGDWSAFGAASWDRVAMVAFLVGGVAVVTAGSLVTLRARGRSRLPVGLVTAGMLVYLVADATLLGVGSLDAYVPGTVADTGWLAAFLLVGLGALGALDRPVHRPAEARVTLAGSALVYVPVGLALVVELVVGEPLLGSPVGLATAGAGLGLILVRQTVAFAGNLSVQRQLEAVLTERTAELSTREARFEALVAQSSDMIALISADGEILQHSAAAERVLGYEAEGLIGNNLRTLMHPDDLGSAGSELARLGGSPGASASVEVRLAHAEGHWVPVEATATNLLHDPTVEAMVYNLRDISERKAAEQQLQRRLSRDALTGLANRRALRDRVEAALDEEARATLLLVNLHRFRAVNDRYGHAVGDDVLRQVAQRLEDAAGPDALVARTGGEEFAVLAVPDAEVDTLARRLLAEVGRLEAQGRPVPVRANIGYTICTPPASAADALRHAGIAVSAATEVGPGAVVAYTAELEQDVLGQLELEQDLREALAGDALELHYQPIIDVGSSRVDGVEALLRWTHPERGPISPAEFVPVAERSELIGLLDRWVIERALRQAAQWAQRGAGAPWVAINLSSRNLHDPGFTEAIAAALRQTGCPADQVVLEITETALAATSQPTIVMLESLRALGVRLAIDDFGTGYSSLGRLRDFPVEKLKVDRSFIAEIIAGVHAPIPAAIIGMAHELGLKVVAEGVQTGHQLAVLSGLGCDFVQGWLLARAEPPEIVAARFEHEQ